MKRDGSLLLVALLLIASCKSTDSPTQSQDSGDVPDVRWLFVQTAMSGSFDGTYLTLDQVPPTLMFSDRPNRVTGHMTTSSLIDKWDEGDNSFAKDPPNAVLSALGGEGEPTLSTVVLISKPTIDGAGIRYRVRVLEGEIPGLFDQASLFIDHWHRHPPIGAFVVGAAVGHSIARASSEPKTVVVADPNYYYQTSPQPLPAQPKSTTQKLQELQNMLDQGLITKSEYDKEKANILADM
jgi:hypothetical protein